VLREHFATLAAVALWAANIVTATAGVHVVTGAQGRLVSGAAVTASVWAIVRHYREPRLKPGEVIISAADYLRSAEIYREERQEAADGTAADGHKAALRSA
jgi:hypothetical protein